MSRTESATWVSPYVLTIRSTSRTGIDTQSAGSTARLARLRSRMLFSLRSLPSPDQTIAIVPLTQPNREAAVRSSHTPGAGADFCVLGLEHVWSSAGPMGPSVEGAVRAARGPANRHKQPKLTAPHTLRSTGATLKFCRPRSRMMWERIAAMSESGCGRLRLGTHRARRSEQKVLKQLVVTPCRVMRSGHQ